MFVEIDLSSVPVVATLHEPDDFTSFKVVVRQSGHCYVSPETLRALAEERAADPDWQAQFEQMLAYANQHGWVNDTGAVRAHVDSA